MSTETEKTPELLEVFRHADQLYDENHFQETIDLLLKQTENISDIKWRLARAYYALSKTVDKATKETHIREGFKCAKEALELNEQNFASHKWYAVLLDADSELDGIKPRASNLEKVKFHMEQAVKLNPMDPTSWYMLGQFEFSLADMPWFQRKIVETLFATPPSGSFQNALDNFLKAEEIKADFFAMNKLMIGKCYLKLKNMEKAKEYIELATNVTVNNADDKQCKEEATNLFKKF